MDAYLKLSALPLAMLSVSRKMYLLHQSFLVDTVPWHLRVFCENIEQHAIREETTRSAACNRTMVGVLDDLIQIFHLQHGDKSGEDHGRMFCPCQQAEEVTLERGNDPWLSLWQSSPRSREAALGWQRQFLQVSGRPMAGCSIV